jgi:transposase InsO family protein
VSIRRACEVLLVGKSTYHYKSRRRGQVDIEKRIKEIAETRMRYGYRRVHVVLQREGWMINVKLQLNTKSSATSAVFNTPVSVILFIASMVITVSAPTCVAAAITSA